MSERSCLEYKICKTHKKKKYMSGLEFEETVNTKNSSRQGVYTKEEVVQMI
jgi:hypothetical protein